jgi:hypothetical protein
MRSGALHQRGNAYRTSALQTDLYIGRDDIYTSPAFAFYQGKPIRSGQVDSFLVPGYRVIKKIC